MKNKKRLVDITQFCTVKRRAEATGHVDEGRLVEEMEIENETVNSQSEQAQTSVPVSQDNVGTSSEAASRQDENETGTVTDEKETFINDIGEAVGKVMSPPERYSYLMSPWIPSKNFEFPCLSIGSKNRRFQMQWIDNFPWLTYSPSQNGGFCKFCVLFAPQGGGCGFQPLQSFVKIPWRNFNRANESLTRHTSNDYHKLAVQRGGEFLKLYTSPACPTVLTMVDKGRQLTIEWNRKRLIPIMKTVIFCGQNNLALRGHRDDGELLSLESQMSNLSGLHGVFRALLAFRLDAGDTVLRKHLEESKKNATMISKTIQNEFINVAGNFIQLSLQAKIKKAKYFSILCDETSDISKKEQMSICVRYVDMEELIIREDFLGFQDVSVTTGAGLKASLEEFLKNVGLTLEFCRGQGYDGGSNMAGKFKGLKSLVLAEHPLAFFTHCFSHNLNLSVSKACSVTLISNMISAVATVSSFITASPQRYSKLKTSVQNSELIDSSFKNDLKAYSPTRWLERQDSLRRFQELYPGIYDALDELQELGDSKTRTLASSFQLTITRSEFLVPLHTAIFVMQFTKKLSTQLQAVELDLDQALCSIKTVLLTLESVKEHAEMHFRGIFNDVERIATRVGTVLAPPRIVKRQNYRTSGPTASAEEYYRNAVFIPFLDHFISELRSRFFEEKADCFLLQGLIPCHLSKFTDEAIMKGAKIYAMDIKPCTESELKSELLLWRTKWSGVKELPATAIEAIQSCDPLTPNIKILLQLFATLPVTTCSAERSFSVLRRLLTYLRSTMLEDRLNGLALMHIYKDLELDVDQLVDMFAKRRMNIADWSQDD